LQAEAADHPARIVDASVFELGGRATRTPASDEALVEPAQQTMNVIALWRLNLLNLRGGLLSGDADLVDRSLRAVRASSPVIHPLFADGVEAFAALVAAYRHGDFEPLMTPQRVGLVNLPCIFAGIEAVAIAGSQDNAAEWKAWADAEMPPFVATALDWPVSLARIRGLLHVRAGSVPTGVRLLRDAIRWADDHEYAVEAALARLQLGEVLSHGGVRTVRMGEARAMRREGWAALPELGVAPAPQAYAATRAVSLNRDDLSMPRLTGREIDVLALLAEGMSYREVGDRLQISWRTAQLHANRIYSKLGVHGKMQAVGVARELKIL
jgi:DNA-binding CsgD family transcriptional regulator